MTIQVNRDDAREPLCLPTPRTVDPGRVEGRVARGRPRSAGAKPWGKPAIRAWRAADAEVSKAPQRADRLSATLDGKPVGCPRAAATPAGPRPNGPDRTARMRAVEQAWKAERARQAELEAAADDKAREPAEALRQAEELEAKRQADQRIRVALERANRSAPARSLTKLRPGQAFSGVRGCAPRRRRTSGEARGRPPRAVPPTRAAPLPAATSGYPSP